ncbi:MAG: DUF58 domain-containing protein [Bacteroidota bacterium]
MSDTREGWEKGKPVRGLEFLARQLVEGYITGLHKSPYHGFSVEFAEHRLYNTGQDTKHIDWKVYARTDKLFTRQYEEETNLRCLMVIDGSSSMFYPLPNQGKIKFSIEAVSALAWLLHRQRDAVGLCLFDERIQETTPVSSTRASLDKLYTTLEQYLLVGKNGQKKTNTAEILHEIAEKTHRRSLIILFTDMFESGANLDEIFKALQHLRHNRHEVLIFHVYDGATEVGFQFDDRPHEFIDLETGERLRLNPMEIRSGFQERMEEFHKKISLNCHQLKVDLVRADIRLGFQAVLQAYLIKRSRMR